MSSAQEIKELCIAREALSRIPGQFAERFAERIEGILNEVTNLFNKELSARKRASPADTENEIPF